MALEITDNTSDGVDHGAALDYATGTLIAWYYVDSVANLLRYMAGNDNSMGYTAGIGCFKMSADGTRIRFRYHGSTQNCDTRFNASTLQVGWNYIAFSWDFGVEITAYHGTLTSLASDVTDSGNTTLGGGSHSGAGGNWHAGTGPSLTNALGGKLGQMQLHNVVLSLAQIQAQQYRFHPLSSTQLMAYYGYHGVASVPDLSGNGNDGTVVGTVVTTDHVPIFQAFGYDEEVPYVVAIGGLSISVSETITSTESLTESMPLGEILKFDNVTIAEFRALLMSIAPSVFKNISISEYLSLIISIKPDIHQNINITEAITILKDIGVDVNEQISIQEIIAILLEFSVNIQENVQLQEFVNLAISGAGEISKSETISIVEAFTMALPLGGISVFEAIELIEYIKVSLPISTTIIQQLTVQEYLSILTRVSPSVFENIEISEFAQLLLNISPDIFESINISEYTAAAIGAVSISVSVYDVLSVVENIVMSMSMSTTISQVVQVTENIIVLLNPLIFNQSDTISIIESITVMVGILAVGRVTAAITSKSPGATITSKTPGATIT